MLNEPQISFGQALDIFQGQISLKVIGTQVAQDMVRGSKKKAGYQKINIKI